MNLLMLAQWQSENYYPTCPPDSGEGSGESLLIAVVCIGGYFLFSVVREMIADHNKHKDTKTK